MYAKLLPLFALAACATAPAPIEEDAKPATAMSEWAESCADFDEWDKPAPPFQIYGSTWYVGTCGISSILVTNAQGHFLIDSGTDKGAEIVLANIRTLGFDPRDVKLILMSHEHFDHVGGMARLQAATGATIVASPEAAAVLRSGLPGAGDPQAQSGHPPFPPVIGPIAIIEEQLPQIIADREMIPIFTPGHTLGATSWTWRSCEDAGCRSIVYVDSLNPISSDGYRFSDHSDLLRAFRKGIADVGALDCDIVLAPHPSAANMRSRLLGEAPLIDRQGCRKYTDAVTARLDKRLADEAAQ